MLKDYKNFLNENKKLSKIYTDSNGNRIYDGNFMNGIFSVINGKLKISKYNIIKGDFICNSIELKTLEGCPDTVLGNFECSNNKLKDLKGGPSIVYGNYSCLNIKLTSLEGFPKELKGDFIIEYSIKAFFVIELKYVKSDYFKYDNYWKGLLEYMLKERIDYNKIKTWPEGFLTNNIKKSAKSIGKFNL